MEDHDERADFGGATPILRVTDIRASLAYYVDTLGFGIDWQAEDGFAGVRRGRAALMLGTGDQGRVGAWCYIGVDDVDLWHAELQRKGVPVRHPPTNYPWGARELQLEDPDGNVLRFGSDATDEPFGAWRDGHGKLWWPQEDGSWREG